MRDDLAPLLAFAHELADLARPIARAHFRTGHAVDDKPDHTPVTAADRAIEATLRERIAAAFPEHGVLGEEHGQERLDAEHVWVLDPIDGTKAFTAGSPLFGTLIGLCRRGRPIVGVLDAPALGERYHGALGHGSFCADRRLVTRPTTAVERAVLWCTTPDSALDDPGHRALRARVRWTGYGGDCLAYAWLAAGGVDLIVDRTLRPYDWCALVPIVEEAGGALRGFRGEALTLDGPGDVVAAATPELAAAARAALAG